MKRGVDLVIFVLYIMIFLVFAAIIYVLFSPSKINEESINNHLNTTFFASMINLSENNFQVSIASLSNEALYGNYLIKIIFTNGTSTWEYINQTIFTSQSNISVYYFSKQDIGFIPTGFDIYPIIIDEEGKEVIGKKSSGEIHFSGSNPSPTTNTGSSGGGGGGSGGGGSGGGSGFVGCANCPRGNSWCNNSDINRDGKVDTNDSDVLGWWFLFYREETCLAENTWCNNSDINRDGKVDTNDYDALDRWSLFNKGKNCSVSLNYCIGGTCSECLMDSDCLTGQICINNQCIEPLSNRRDSDSDGYNVSCLNCGLLDCDDSNRYIYPGAVEMCNLKDDNCNGQTDENCHVCYCGDLTNDGLVNAWDMSILFNRIVNSLGTDNCSLFNEPIWCNNSDLNHDGNADNLDFQCMIEKNPGELWDMNVLCSTCSEGDSIPCYIYINQTCRGGKRECADGKFGECLSSPPNYENICDYIDNDCDGEIDEGMGYTCRDYIDNCRQYHSCEPCPVAPIEVCDDLDNDCDGEIDESCLSWKKVNNGNSIGSYENVVESASIDSISTNEDLIYFFNSQTIGKVMGNLNNNRVWEIWTETGWSNSPDAIPKPVSISDYIGDMEIFENIGTLFGIYSAYGKAGLKILDIHGGQFHFLFDGNNWLKWKGNNQYSTHESLTLLYSWNGIDMNFAYNGDTGIGVGSYGYSLGGDGARLTAVKFYKNQSEWKLWNGSGWGALNTNYNSYIPVPAPAEVHNMPSFYSPKITYLGEGIYFLTFLYNKSIVGAIYNDNTQKWKWWNNGWQDEGNFSYSDFSNINPDSIISVSNLNPILVDHTLFIFFKRDYGSYNSELLEIRYNITSGNWNTESITNDSDISHFLFKEDERGNIWLFFLKRPGDINLGINRNAIWSEIYSMKRDYNGWGEPQRIYASLKRIPNLNGISFINNSPLVFFTEESKLYGISDYSSNLMENEKIINRTQMPQPISLDTNKIEFTGNFTDYSNGMDYGESSSGNPAIDSKGILYSPHVRVCNVAIFNLSNYSQNNFWGGFWDYFLFPSSVAVDNSKGIIYISDYLTPGGAGGVYGGRIQVWNTSLSNQTLWSKRYGGRQGWAIPEKVNPKIVYSSFKFLSDLAVDETNEFLYASDSMNNRIQKFDASSPWNLRKISDIGSEGESNGEFSFPQGIDVDEEGNLYVVDTGNYRIEKFDKDGNFILSFGSLGWEEGNFIQPYGISADPYYNLVYVSDPVKKEVQIFSKNGEFIYRWNKWGILDFSSLSGLVADGKGNLYVASEYSYIGKILKFSIISPEIDTNHDKIPDSLQEPQGINLITGRVVEEIKNIGGFLQKLLKFFKRE